MPRKVVEKAPQPRVAWRPREFRESLPISHGQMAEWIRDGYIPSVKIGGLRLITESPEAFIERHRQQRSA